MRYIIDVSLPLSFQPKWSRTFTGKAGQVITVNKKSILRGLAQVKYHYIMSDSTIYSRVITLQQRSQANWTMACCQLMLA